MFVFSSTLNRHIFAVVFLNHVFIYVFSIRSIYYLMIIFTITSINLSIYDIHMGQTEGLKRYFV